MEAKAEGKDYFALTANENNNDHSLRRLCLTDRNIAMWNWTKKKSN